MNGNEQLSETFWYLFEAKLTTETKCVCFQPIYYFPNVKRSYNTVSIISDSKVAWEEEIIRSPGEQIVTFLSLCDSVMFAPLWTGYSISM